MADRGFCRCWLLLGLLIVRPLLAFVCGDFSKTSTYWRLEFAAAFFCFVELLLIVHVCADVILRVLLIFFSTENDAFVAEFC
jgi:hypothetical protein